MTDALDYAQGAGQCQEIVTLHMIDRFGVEAVMGRKTLSRSEIKQMVIAENIINAYKSRNNYKDESGKVNWVEWANKYPDMSGILVLAERLSDGR